MSAGQSGRDYTTSCPLALDEQHQWKVEPWASTGRIFRFKCECGARGWRDRAPGAPLVQYAPKSKRAVARFSEGETRPLKPETITARQHPGSNANGHRLPASGGRR